jgi:rRNA biogenesis protein RRP5
VLLDVSTISKFAQLEFRHGNAERGRTIFENILGHYPKRIDLWAIYIDMESKYVGDVEIIRYAHAHSRMLALGGMEILILAASIALHRHIFDKATSLMLSSKKMKFLFKRYLAFEREHGNAQGVENVKQKAQQYLEAKAAAPHE